MTTKNVNHWKMTTIRNNVHNNSRNRPKSLLETNLMGHATPNLGTHNLLLPLTGVIARKVFHGVQWRSKGGGHVCMCLRLLEASPPYPTGALPLDPSGRLPSTRLPLLPPPLSKFMVTPLRGRANDLYLPCSRRSVTFFTTDYHYGTTATSLPR